MSGCSAGPLVEGHGRVDGAPHVHGPPPPPAVVPHGSAGGTLVPVDDPPARDPARETPGYPPSRPHASGLLDVGDGQHVHWETCGDPRARPPWCCTAGRARAPAARGPACSTPPRTGSCCSTSAAAGAWEERHVTATTARRTDPRYADPAFRMRFARLVTHCWRHAARLGDDELVTGAGGLAGVPGVLVHGRADLDSPPEFAWRVHRAWPGSELVLVDGAGHGADDAMTRAVVAATDRFRAPSGARPLRATPGTPLLQRPPRPASGPHPG